MELSPDTIAVYTRRALNRMGEVLEQFDDDTVNQRPPGPDTNTAAGLITHACSAAVFWFENPGLGRPTDRVRESEFFAEATVAELRARLADTAARLDRLAAEMDSGPTAVDHEVRALLWEDDRSDGAVVLHALEELYQHLGHLELTADALGG